MNNLLPYQLENRAIHSTALAFNRQMPLSVRRMTVLDIDSDEMPPGVVVTDDGSLMVSFYGPYANAVDVWLDNIRTQLKKDEKGIWSGRIPFSSAGHKPIRFSIDGTDVLNPLAPIGFGASKPMNCIDIPETECDFYYLKDVEHGTVCSEMFKSTVTGEFEECLVYTPPGYMRGNEAFPILYLQHGHGENEKCWLYQGKINFIMDNLISEGNGTPCLIVMCNGMVQSKDRAGECIVDPYVFEQVLLDDVIPFVENRYRVKQGKVNRALAGLSMGSMQTSIIAFRHPDLFAWAGLFSGFLRNKLGDDDGHLEILNEPERLSREFSLIFRAMGIEDEYLGDFLEDDLMLKEKGFLSETSGPFVRKTYSGAHEWQVWRKCAHDFLKIIFK